MLVCLVEHSQNKLFTIQGFTVLGKRLHFKAFVAGVRKRRELSCRMTCTITNGITAIYWLNSIFFCMGAIVYAHTDVDYSINNCYHILYLM